MIDTILEKFGLKYEDLQRSERETLDKWMVALQENQLSVEKVREFVTSMREGVEEELCKSNLRPKKDIFLKARLRNLLLLEGFMTSPERAKQHIEAALAGIAAKR